MSSVLKVFAVSCFCSCDAVKRSRDYGCVEKLGKYERRCVQPVVAFMTFINPSHCFPRQGGVGVGVDESNAGARFLSPDDKVSVSPSASRAALTEERWCGFMSCWSSLPL